MFPKHQIQKILTFGLYDSAFSERNIMEMKGRREIRKEKEIGMREKAI